MNQTPNIENLTHEQKAQMIDILVDTLTRIWLNGEPGTDELLELVSALKKENQTLRDALDPNKLPLGHEPSRGIAALALSAMDGVPELLRSLDTPFAKLKASQIDATLETVREAAQSPVPTHLAESKT